MPLSFTVDSVLGVVIGDDPGAFYFFSVFSPCTLTKKPLHLHAKSAGRHASLWATKQPWVRSHAELPFDLRLAISNPTLLSV
eukprot:232331-Pleurochrysis_carterae.AAC.1